ncbi:MAG: SHD1 domain-containing protein [Verrucomicrobiota bacterium]
MSRTRYWVGAALAWSLAVAGAGSEMRTWTSVSGVKVTAEFVEMQGNFAVLRGENGKDMKVDVGKLSAADRAYVHDLVGGAAPAKQVPDRPVGQIIKDVAVDDAPEWSYLLYLPSTFKPDRKWPVLYILGPGGGSEYDVQRYVKGAEFNGWILAMSTQRRNGFDDSGKAVRAMDHHVRRTLPIDEDMVFITGMSGGTRDAFWYASEEGRSFAGDRKLHFAGVLACGAGTEYPLTRKTVTYGLCGSNCFNRWDMACSFKTLLNRDWRLRFFPGNHDWANDDLLMDAMCWLEGYCLKNAKATDPQIAERREAYLTRMLGRIKSLAQSDVERAYDAAAFLADFPLPGPALTGVNECLQELLKKPEVQLYVQGLKDMEKFVDKFYGQNPNGLREENGSHGVQGPAEKYATKYAGTSLAEVFRRMGQRSVEP